MCINLVFDGDFMFPLKEYEENRPYDYKDFLSEKLINSIDSWIKEYDKHTAKSFDEIMRIEDIVNELDDFGISLTKRIGDELSGKINKIYYYSLYKHKYLKCFDVNSNDMD